MYYSNNRYNLNTHVYRFHNITIFIQKQVIIIFQNSQNYLMRLQFVSIGPHSSFLCFSLGPVVLICFLETWVNVSAIAITADTLGVSGVRDQEPFGLE